MALLCEATRSATVYHVQCGSNWGDPGKGDLVADTIFWLRLSYRGGAIIDALTVIPMLLPDVGGRLFGIVNFHPGADYRYAMAVGA